MPKIISMRSASNLQQFYIYDTRFGSGTDRKLMQILNKVHT